MRTDLIKAKELLENGGYTCVFCKQNEILDSFERGVKPLLDLLESGVSLNGFCAADKVVGKAAALLYVLLNPDCVYTRVISKPALDVLENNNITVFYDALTEAIINRAGDGFCPMETAVKNTDEPAEALRLIKQRLKR